MQGLYRQQNIFGSMAEPIRLVSLYGRWGGVAVAIKAMSCNGMSIGVGGEALDSRFASLSTGYYLIYRLTLVRVRNDTIYNIFGKLSPHI